MARHLECWILQVFIVRFFIFTFRYNCLPLFHYCREEVTILKWQTGGECFASLKAICLTIPTLISWWIWFYNNHYRHHQVMSHHIFPRHIIKKWFMHSVGAWIIHRPFKMKTSVSTSLTYKKSPFIKNTTVWLNQIKKYIYLCIKNARQVSNNIAYV